MSNAWSGLTKENDMLRRGEFERFIGKDGQYYFRLKAGNGEIIATSEAYTTPQARDKGIRSMRVNAPFARLTP